MKAIYVEYRYQSSFWVSEPLTTAHRPSYIVPPPTTLVGALSYGIARVLHSKGRDSAGELEHGTKTSSTFKKLSRIIKHVFYTQLEGYATLVEDITRFFQGPYIEAENVLNPNMRWGTKISSKIYLPLAKAAVIYVLSNDVEKQIEPEILLQGAYSMKRIGSVESLIDVERVELIDVDEKPFDEDLQEAFIDQRIYFYMDVGSARLDPLNWILLRLPTHRRLDTWISGDVYRAYTQFLVPADRNLAKMRILTPFTWGPEVVEIIIDKNKHVFDKMNAYIVKIDGKNIVLPHPRE